MTAFKTYILSRTPQVNFISRSGVEQSHVLSGDTGNAAELQAISSDVTSAGRDRNIIAVALANTNLTADKLSSLRLTANASATDGTDWAVGLKESYIKSSKTASGNIAISATGLCQGSQDPTARRRFARRGDPSFGMQDATLELGGLNNLITLTSTATAGNWTNEAVAYGINGGSIDAQDSNSSLSNNGESKKYSLITGDGNDSVIISAKASNIGLQYRNAASPFADAGQQRSVGIHNSALNFGNGNNTLRVETGVSLGNAPSSYRRGALYAKSSSLFDGTPSTSQETSAGASADLNKALLQFGSGDDTIDIYNSWYSDIYLGKGDDTINLAAGNELYVHSAGGNSTINFSQSGTGSKSSISAFATSTEVFNKVTTSEGTVYVDKSITININGKEEYKGVDKIINILFSSPKITPGIVVEGQQSFLVITHDQFTGGEELKLSYSIGNNKDLALGETDFTTNQNMQKGQILVPISAFDNIDSDGNRDVEFTLTTSINGTIKYTTQSTITILDDEPAASILPPVENYLKKLKALNFQAPNTGPGDPGGEMSKYYNYVDRYKLTLKDAYINDYRANRTSSQAVWGESHWFANGINSGRVLEVIDGTEDINDYGAYVENYGSTLLDIYRRDPRSVVNGGGLSMFNWGKEHFNGLGQAAGREISGGVDWGAIVKNRYDLYTQWQDARRLNPSLTAFVWGSTNRAQLTNTLGIKVGSDNTDILTGNFVYAQNGNDIIGGTSSNDIFSGGFGDDIIVGHGGGTDTAYGGPGRDVFHITKDTKLLIRDFRDGADMIQLGDGLVEKDVKIEWDGLTESSNIIHGSDVIANIYGIEPNQLSFAIQSDGIDNVFI